MAEPSGWGCWLSCRVGWAADALDAPESLNPLPHAEGRRGQLQFRLRARPAPLWAPAEPLGVAGRGISGIRQVETGRQRVPIRTCRQM